MKFLYILLLCPLFSWSQECEETFKKTVSVHYTYTILAHKGGGMDWGLTGDISPLSFYVGYGVSVADSPVFKVGEDSVAVNFRLYTKLAWRVKRWDYKLALNGIVMMGFDNRGGFVAPGIKLFMPAGINTALSLEPYYIIREDRYLIQLGLHFKFR